MATRNMEVADAHSVKALAAITEARVAEETIETDKQEGETEISRRDIENIIQLQAPAKHKNVGVFYFYAS